MELKDVIIDAIDVVKKKPEGYYKLKLDFNGYEFHAMIITCERKLLIPTKFVEKRKEPTIIVWIGNRGVIRYTWYQLIYNEIVGQMVFHFSKIIGIDLNKYLVKDFDDFHEEQGVALIDGTYNDLDFKYSDAYSERDYIHLSYRDPFDGKRYKRIIEDYEWYFYIKAKDYPEVLSLLEEFGKSELIDKVEPEEPDYLRIYCKNRNSFETSKDRRKDPAWVLKEMLTGVFKTFEADIRPSMRYTIDNELNIETDLKILYFDIETDDESGGIDMERNAILSIGAVDNDGEEYFKASSNEKLLLIWWEELVRHYDIIIGYNSYNFDSEYIELRSKLYKMYWRPTIRWSRCGHIDMMRRIMGTYGKLTGLRSYSLEDVSQHFLGKGKVQHEEKIFEMFRSNRKKLREYNLMDCWLLKELDDKLGVSKLMTAMCEWTGSYPSMFKATRAMSGISVSSLLDTYILRTIKGSGIHYKTQIWEDNLGGKRIEGGLVTKPDAGIYKDVHVLDFRSLYPTIISTWRISPENVRYEGTDEDLIISPTGTKFHKTDIAIFPLLVERLMIARTEYKKQMNESEYSSASYEKYNIMQMVAKELTNALYGQMAQRGNRYYDFNVSGSVTGIGRHLLKTIIVFIEEMGAKVIYGDTDSTFVVGINCEDSSPERFTEIINNRLNEYIKNEFNITDSIIELEYEKKLSRFISIKMKNYAGLLSEVDGKQVDKVLIKGLACVRRSTIPMAKKEQEELIDLLLRHDYDQDWYIQYIITKRRDFFTSIIPIEELIQKVRINKHPDEYENAKGPHVRVAEKLIKDHREFWVGMPISFIITDKKNKGVVHSNDYLDQGYDKEYYWDRVFKPLCAVLEVCFPDYKWYMHGKTGAKEKIIRVSKRCPTCGFCRCRCEPQIDDSEYVIADSKEEAIAIGMLNNITVEKKKSGFKVKKKKNKNGFKIKKTQFNKLF